jgi:hypothetical protein
LSFVSAAAVEEYFFCPVEAGSRQQLNRAIGDPRRHAIAVELDLVDPLRAARRLGREPAEPSLIHFGDAIVGL